MKILGAIFILVLTVICSVGLTLYFVKYNRFQIIFEEVLHETKTPSKAEPGLVNVTTDNRRVCLKFDRLTGKTWQLIDSFYFDPNIISEGHGFKELKEGSFFIYSTTSRKAEQTTLPSKRTLEEIRSERKLRLVPDEPNKTRNRLRDLVKPIEPKQMKLPEGFVLDEPNEPIDFRPIEGNGKKPKDD